MSSRNLLDPSPASSSPNVHIPYASAYAYRPSSDSFPPSPLGPGSRDSSAPPSSAGHGYRYSDAYPLTQKVEQPGPGFSASAAAAGTPRRSRYDLDSVYNFFDATRLTDGDAARRRRRPWILAAIALAVLAVAGLAIGLGVHFGRQANASSAAAVTTPSGSSPNSYPNSSSNTNGTTAPNYNVTVVPPLPRWNWTDPNQKMIGISLGNWLILERWMSEDWFVDSSSPDTWDEWTFANNTGERAAELLQAHWDSWVSEDDIEKCHQAGINHIRIPTGYWQWIPTIEGEPYVEAGQLDRLNRVIEWAYNRGMYVMIDLHGLPGSQNGEQESGHNTSDVRFYQPAYQNRSDETLAVALEWISAHPYRSAISSIAVCNEPRPNAADNFAVLQGYYERAYTACTNRSDPVPMFFHHGFPTTNALQYWLPFVQGKDPNYLILEDHPYPGNFPLQNSTSNILEQVCSDAAGYEGYPIPVSITEWSLTTGVSDQSFEQQFYAQQLAAWSFSGGSIFWSLRANTSSNPVLAAAPAQQIQYSFLDLLAQGVVTQPAANQSTMAFLQGLTDQCDAFPGEKWTNGSYATVTASATFGTQSYTVYSSSTAFPTPTTTGPVA